MPPSRAELAAKHARVIELAAAGRSTASIATELRMDRRSVRQIRNDAGHPADLATSLQPLTLEEKWRSQTRESDASHLEWLGEHIGPSRSPVMRYRAKSYSAAAIAFRLRAGREPVGYAIAQCGRQHCVAPEHVDDMPARQRNNQALRTVLGKTTIPVPRADSQCTHDREVHGRVDGSGTPYCAACHNERRRAKAQTATPKD